MTSALPNRPLKRAKLAARMWQAYSGGCLAGEPSETEDGASLRVSRARDPSPAPYPSLVDPSLVWLTIGGSELGESIAHLHWRADGSVSVDLDLHLLAEARSGFERIAQAIVFDAGRVEPPRIDFMDVGRGAWEQAGIQAEPRPCPACPFALASNLDCAECRDVVIARKSLASWSRARIAEGLRALDFDRDLASMVALQTEHVLARVREAMLSHTFFDHWARRFEHATREFFAGEDDLEIARDLIEAQMVQPWFRGPPFAEHVPPLPLPPPLQESALPAQARRKVRDLTLAGVPRWQAERRVEGSLLLRRLLAAEGELLVRELGRGEAQLHGTIDRLYLSIGDGEAEPWIIEVVTPIAREVELRQGLPEEERARLREAAVAVHRRLVDAVEAENRLLDELDDHRALDLALENLRGESGAPARVSTPRGDDREGIDVSEST